ncbi:acyl-CoA dehydrogenase [Ochrobactrum teleogrylli]|uniref:acyl-CoA dehydrogenase n=1 Tax=Ochrobactrum teleogrylli TaxID=2479765 RepID=UPI00384E88FA
MDTRVSDFSNVIGRSESRTARIGRERAEQLAATIDLAEIPGDGKALPPGWHWLWFNPFAKRSEIGPDGHPRKGGFLPDVGLPRRMWAGGRLTYHAPLPFEAMAEKTSTISNVVEKNGKAGRLVFVTVRHQINADGVLCIEEEQDIVYREAAGPDAKAPTPAPAPEGVQWNHEIVPDPVLLFRYSALTSNGHRIHYDVPYARNEEHYPDLVVQGPLTATFLQNFAGEIRNGARLKRFAFRGMSPLFVSAPFRLQAKSGSQPGVLELWAVGPNDGLAMQAEAEFDV